MIQFFAHIREGKISNPQIFRKYFGGLTDGPYLIKIENKKKRSLPQNKFYWGVCCPLVLDGLRDAGYNDVKTIEDAHEILKHLFLKKEIKNEISGDVITIPGSTAKLTTVEFNAYIEEIQRWSVEYLGVMVPDPNTQTLIDY